MIMKNAFQLLTISILIVSCVTNTEKVDYKIETITSPAGPKTEEPNLVLGADGILYMSWIEKTDSTSILNYAKFEKDGWTTPEKIAEGKDWFVNWADYPSLAVNKSGDMVAHYLQKSDSGTYTYDVKVVAKRKGDSNWSLPTKLHSDSVNAEHGFVSIQPFSNGNFFFSWLDGRNTAGAGHDHGGHGGGTMTIRGATLTPDLQKVEDTELDNRVCDCCQTSATMVNDNPFIVYRNRSDEEIRDMYFVQKTQDGWSQPKSVNNDNWKIAGCPVNGPRIANMQKSIATVWFAAPEGNPRVNLAFYDEKASEFLAPIVVDNTNPIGRVDIEMIDSDTAVVSWLDMEEDGAKIKIAKLTKDGMVGNEVTAAQTSESRASGFPQLVKYNSNLYLAYTEVAETSSIQFLKIIY